MDDSRPAPGPLTRTSTSFTPNLDAFSAHASAARWAAYGVLLRLPLNPAVPADAVHRVSPAVSVMVTIVLLNVLWMCAMPRLTFRRALRFLLFAMCSQLSAVSIQPYPRRPYGRGARRTSCQPPLRRLTADR